MLDGLSFPGIPYPNFRRTDKQPDKQPADQLGRRLHTLPAAVCLRASNATTEEWRVGVSVVQRDTGPAGMHHSPAKGRTTAH